MAELVHAFNIKNSISDKTKTNYKNYYKRMLALLGGNEIIKSSNKKIIDVLKKDKEIPASSKQALLNVAIVIKQTHDLKTDELIKFRDTGREKLSEQIATKNIELEKELPSLKELNSFMNSLYKEKDWDAFLVNYLLINFGVSFLFFLLYHYFIYHLWLNSNMLSILKHLYLIRLKITIKIIIREWWLF